MKFCSHNVKFCSQKIMLLSKTLKETPRWLLTVRVICFIYAAEHRKLSKATVARTFGSLELERHGNYAKKSQRHRSESEILSTLIYAARCEQNRKLGLVTSWLSRMTIPVGMKFILFDTNLKSHPSSSSLRNSNWPQTEGHPIAQRQGIQERRDGRDLE